MLLILVLGLSLVAPATAGAPPGIKNETFLAPVPQGFKVGLSSSSSHQAVIELVPSSEDPVSWTRLVKQQVVSGLRSADPDQKPAALSKTWAATCPAGSSRKLVADVEHGYPISLWEFNCPLNSTTGKPEIMWMKTMSGSDGYYSVQYTFRAPPSREMVAVAMAYLKRVMVCDTRKPDRPCPAGRR